MIRASHELQLNTGLLLAVPIPEAHAAEGAAIQRAIQDSLQEAEQQGIAGADVSLLVSVKHKSWLRFSVMCYAPGMQALCAV
jgi:pseudouridine-5'-phosphate glycosidase